MSLFFRRTTIAAVAIATAATFPLVASAAQAAPSATKPAHSHSKHVKSAKHAKHAKKFHARYVLTGRVQAVEEGSVTVAVKGGNLKKSVRGTNVDVAFTETTKITVKGEQKTLADIVVGDRITIKGTRALAEGVTTYTAKRVFVKHVVVKTDPEATTPTPTDTEPTVTS